MLDNYIRYYVFVQKKSEEIQIIDFSDLINNPIQIMDVVAKQLGFEKEPSQIIAEVEKADKTYQGATDKLGSSRPNEFKKQKKKEIFEVLNSLEAFERASKVYRQLITESN